MSLPVIITVVGVTAIVCAIIAYFMAGIKNRNADSWAFFSFIFPPSLILLWLLPKLGVRQHTSHTVERDSPYLIDD